VGAAQLRGVIVVGIFATWTTDADAEGAR